ncbi:transposase, partial [Streptomyces sp. NPDC005227]|uniref:transposase n=1 Tax=Streptomyces sp. NPDC005227 TaxID=3364707 RepID=UPI00369F63BE
MLPRDQETLRGHEVSGQEPNRVVLNWNEEEVAPPSKYSLEFREEAVQIALRSRKTISEVARELELNPETLCGWIKKHQKQQEPAPGAELTVTERARLKELER